jgi:hypothetical protein
MDIKGVEPTAKAEFEVEAPSGELETVRLEVRFVPLDNITDYLPRDAANPGASPPKLAPSIRQMLMDAVVGWDLTENGAPLNCTAENKARILPVIFGLRVTKLNGEELQERSVLDRIFGRALLEFATDAGNYLKN